MKKIVYSIIAVVLALSVGFVYEDSKATVTTFNLIDEESDYKAYVKSWLDEHEKLSKECPIGVIGENPSNIPNDYIKLKEVRKILESFNYDENLVPEKYKDINNKLKNSVNSCIFGIDQLMNGLLHSDNNLVKTGKESVVKSFLIIDEIRREIDKIN